MTDAELLQSYYKDRNSDWIGILLERYTLLLLGLCMKYLKDEHEARDAVQQVFLKVLTELPKYRVEYFKSWIYMVAKNHCLMKLRNRQGKFVQEPTGLEAAEEDRIHELAATEVTYNLLEESIEELNDAQKQCVILFYIHKHSYQQIADKTGYPLANVKSYIQNGKRNLRLILERKMKQSKGNE